MTAPSNHVRTLALAVVVLLPGARTAADDRLDIAGQYRCEGENPRGGNYRGTVSITQKGDTYILKWTLPEDQQVGVGILEGDFLSVSWLTRGGAGVAAYKIRDDGNTLIGRWAMLGGDGRAFPETLSRKIAQKGPPSLVEARARTFPAGTGAGGRLQ